MARLAGFEPATYGFEVRYSIQLNYRRIIQNLGRATGLEPATTGATIQCSTN